jgi:hypothetical protein
MGEARRRKMSDPNYGKSRKPDPYKTLGLGVKDLEEIDRRERKLPTTIKEPVVITAFDYAKMMFGFFGKGVLIYRPGKSPLYCTNTTQQSEQIMMEHYDPSKELILSYPFIMQYHKSQLLKNIFLSRIVSNIEPQSQVKIFLITDQKEILAQFVF